MSVEPKVSIVVSPREKFSSAKRSLESLLDTIKGENYELIYVDGRSPRHVRDYLRQRSEEASFKLIRTEHYLSPNQAKNIGFAQSNGDYIIFVDNDVEFAPGWLSPMVDCANKTGAALVTPLTCEREPVHTIVHFAGGDCGIREIQTEMGVERHLFDRIYKQNKPVDAIPKERVETGLVEYHCVLIRRNILNLLGGFDEAMPSTRDHVDFCLSVKHLGGKIWLEPRSVVTFLHDVRMAWYDMPFFMLRWGDEWQKQSIMQIAQKWNLSINGPLSLKLNHLSWRRRDFMIRPHVEHLLGGFCNEFMIKAVTHTLSKVERMVNGSVYKAHKRRLDKFPHWHLQRNGPSLPLESERKHKMPSALAPQGYMQFFHTQHTRKRTAGDIPAHRSVNPMTHSGGHPISADIAPGNS